MWKGTRSFSEAELAELGSCKIAGEELIFRHSAFKTPSSETHPRGLDVDFEPGPEHEAWVEEQWDKDEKWGLRMAIARYFSGRSLAKLPNND